MEGAGKFEAPVVSAKQREAETAETVEIANWRAAREAAPSWVAERLGNILDAEPTAEKVYALRNLLNELENMIDKDSDLPKSEQRLAFYRGEIVAKLLQDTERILTEQKTSVHQERSQFPVIPASDYLGKY